MQKWLAFLFIEIAKIVFYKLVEWARAMYQRLKKDQEIQQRAEEQAAAVNRSQTEQEDERAAREILSRRD
jgi:hypothetical protein